MDILDHRTQWCRVPGRCWRGLAQSAWTACFIAEVFGHIFKNRGIRSYLYPYIFSNVLAQFAWNGTFKAEVFDHICIHFYFPMCWLKLPGSKKNQLASLQMPRNQSLGGFSSTLTSWKCDFDLEKTFQLMKMFRQGCKGWKSFECTIKMAIMTMTGIFFIGNRWLDERSLTRRIATMTMTGEKK